MTSTVISQLSYQQQAVPTPPVELRTYSTVLPMSLAREDQWVAALNDLIGLYRDIERRSLTLPAFSIVPTLVYFWAAIKFTFCLYADMLLLIPINLIIFVRNLFPGRWRYRSFSGKYLKYVARWVWQGEIYMATIHVRWLTKYLLNLHFRYRLDLLRRQLLLDDLDTRARDNLLLQTDRALQAWPSFNVFAFAFTYGLPVFGWTLNVVQDLYGHELSKILNLASVLLMPYALAVVGSAFFIKRGLMLGGRGSSAYYGGALVGAGAYNDEARILESMGVRAREFPFDVLIVFLGFGPSVYSEITFRPANAPIDYGLLFATYSVVLFVTIGLVTLAMWRRRKLGRS